MSDAEVASVDGLGEKLGSLADASREFAGQITQFAMTLPSGSIFAELAKSGLYVGTGIGLQCRRAKMPSTLIQVRECLNIAHTRSVDIFFWLRLVADCQLVERKSIVPLEVLAHKLSEDIVDLMQLSKTPE